MSASSIDTHGDESPADRLNRLFTSIRPGDGIKEYSNKEIARRVGKTDVYIGMLRRGERTPSWQVARRIEEAFGLNQRYLLVDDPSVVQATDEQLRALREMRDGGVWPLAMRAQQVRTPEGRAAVAKVIEHVLQMEKDQRDGKDQLDGG